MTAPATGNDVEADRVTAPTFAAVDLGSNSFHMVVAQARQGQPQIIDRLREMVRLAAGLSDDGELAEPARIRALECLSRFGQRLRDIPSGHIRALATNTFRRARNSQGFLEEAESALGHPIEIISGHEEARLIYHGVARGLASDGGNRLVIDIGGGSTEFIIGNGLTPIVLQSIPIGCVELSERFFPNGKISKSRLKAAQTAVALELRPIRQIFRTMGWQDVVGSSGTIRAAARALSPAGSDLKPITIASVKKLRGDIEGAKNTSNLRALGISDERRSVFPGGVAILEACFRNLGIEEMRISDFALREGALFDLVGRMNHEDPRRDSVVVMATRYQVDQAHAKRVATTAIEAFDQLCATWQLPLEFRDYLEWAAQLHEVGLAVSHDRFNEHSQYLVEHSAMAGFSRQEQSIIATLIKIHRRKFTPDEALRAVPSRLSQVTLRSSAILRLAALLHRSRLTDSIPAPQWVGEGETLTLTFPSGWFADHPLTWADLESEQAELKRAKIHLKWNEGQRRS